MGAEQSRTELTSAEREAIRSEAERRANELKARSRESGTSASTTSPPKPYQASYMDSFVQQVTSYQEVGKPVARSAAKKGAYSDAPYITSDTYTASRAVEAYENTRQAFSPLLREVNGVAVARKENLQHAYGNGHDFIEEQIKKPVVDFFATFLPQSPPPPKVGPDSWQLNAIRSTPSKGITRNRFNLMANEKETKASAKIEGAPHNGNDAWETADRIKTKKHTQGAIKKAHIGVKATVDSENMHIKEARSAQAHLKLKDKAEYMGIKATIPADSYLIDNQKGVHELLHADVAGTSTTVLPVHKNGPDSLLSSHYRITHEAVSEAKRSQYGESAIILGSAEKSSSAGPKGPFMPSVRAAASGVRRALFGAGGNEELQSADVVSAAELAAEVRLAGIEEQIAKEGSYDQILAHRYFEMRRGVPEEVVEAVATGHRPPLSSAAGMGGAVDPAAVAALAAVLSPPRLPPDAELIGDPANELSA